MGQSDGEQSGPSAAEGEENLDWSHGIGELGRAGIETRRTATPEERERLTRLLDILAVDRLEVRYRIRALAGDRYRLAGHLNAIVHQACVVTLEPVRETISEPLAVEFWPAEEVASRLDTEFDALSEDDPEALDRDRIPVGSYIYQVLASSLAPYPRSPDLDGDIGIEIGGGPDGAKADDASQPTEEPRRASPFAVLGKLKSGSNPDSGQS